MQHITAVYDLECMYYILERYSIGSYRFYGQLSSVFSKCSLLEPVLVNMIALVVSVHYPPIAATAAIPIAVSDALLAVRTPHLPWA